MAHSPHVPTAAAPTPLSAAGLRTSARLSRRTLALVWRSSRLFTLVFFGLTLAGALIPLGVAYAGKCIVDGALAHSTESTFRWVMVELLLVLGLSAVQRGLGLARSILGARLGVDINVAILEKATRMDLRDFEDAEFYDSLTKARREASSRPVALVTETFQLVQNIITLIGYGALLVRYSVWVVLLLVIATVPATVAEMRFAKIAFRIRNWRSPESRRLLYLEYVLASDEHAKEIKLFGLGPLFLARYRELAETFYREDKALSLRRAATTHALSILATLAFYGSYAAMAVAAAAGAITLGMMTLYVLSFRSGQQAFQSSLAAIGNIYEHNLYMSNLFAFLDGRGESPRAANAAAGLPLGAPPVGAPSIQFEDVGFRYPGKEEFALRHVNISIARGEKVALVGQNGAGKTTLVKLLTRLYEPTEGRVLIDGKDARDWDVDDLRKRVGVVFQDFNQYQLLLRENVAVGSLPHMEDEARLARAVSRGGADALLAELPKGFDTQLGRWFKDGTELSGGQWQKVALARAFMREEAEILILDEPTAALDADAEHAVFTRFAELARDRTTVVISHRFPTVRLSDRIFVLDGGTVAEEGTHESLVALGGRYARMFALQAEGYQ